MSSLVTGSIEGVDVLEIEQHADDRGALSEVYRRAWVPGAGEAIQANLSESKPGVLRGLHWHRRQRDYWCFFRGSAFAALVDLREGSPTRLEVVTLALEADDRPVAISIPPGVAHGFAAETNVLLLYLVDAYYTGEDEFGLAWDDPRLAIAWPNAEPVLSERDRSNPSLAEVLRDPPRYPSG
jgi:dTDP-4-dehydrorhamnose 3,5-epimerase